MVVILKGFARIIEISLAILILAISIWLSLSSVNIKHAWAEHELVSQGISISHALKAYGFKNLLSNLTLFLNLTEYFAAENMYFGIEISGMPKPVIKVACANCTGKEFSFLKNLLTPVYYNSRWVNFSVSPITFTSLDDVKDYDILVFINFTRFDSNTLIQDYLSTGGKIIAITDIISAEFNNMDETFSLERVQPTGVSKPSNFSSYSFHEPFIEKYFFASGFRVEAPNKIDSKQTGVWIIWLNETKINITPSLEVEIEGVGMLEEGEVFCLNAREKNNGLPNNNYCFRIRKVFPKEVYIQPLNTSFIFPDFLDVGEIKVKASSQGREILIAQLGVGQPKYSLCVLNATTSRALWISYFPQSSEYQALLKGIILAFTTSFTLKTFQGTSGISLPIYAYTCCDIPEEVKIKLSLGYKY